jgi:hypothetical protein
LKEYLLNGEGTQGPFPTTKPAAQTINQDLKDISMGNKCDNVKGSTAPFFNFHRKRNDITILNGQLVHICDIFKGRNIFS